MINKIMKFISFILFFNIFLFGTVSAVSASTVNAEEQAISLSEKNKKIIENTICVEKEDGFKDDLMNRLIYSTFSKDGLLSYNLDYLNLCTNKTSDVPDGFSVPFETKATSLVPAFLEVVVLFSLLIAMFYIIYNAIELKLQQTQSGQFLGGNLDPVKTITKNSLVFLCLVPGLGSKVVNPNGASQGLDNNLNLATVITLSFYGFSNDIANSIWRSFLEFKISSTPKVTPKYSPLSKLNNANALQNFLDCNLKMSQFASSIKDLEVSFYKNESYFNLDSDSGPAYIIESSPLLRPGSPGASINHCYLGVSPLKINLNPMMSKLKTMNDVLELSGLENIFRFEAMNEKVTIRQWKDGASYPLVVDNPAADVIQYDKMFERIYNLETAYAEKMRDLVIEYLEASAFSYYLIKKYPPSGFLPSFSKAFYLTEHEEGFYKQCETNRHSDYDLYFSRLDELRNRNPDTRIEELETVLSRSDLGDDLMCAAKTDREFERRVNEYKKSLTKYYSQKLSNVLSDPSFNKMEGVYSEFTPSSLASCSVSDQKYKECFEQACGDFIRETSTMKSLMTYALSKAAGNRGSIDESWDEIKKAFFDNPDDPFQWPTPRKSPPLSTADSLNSLLSCSHFLTETEDYRHYKISYDKGWLMSAPYLYGFSHVNDHAAELMSSQSLKFSFSSTNFGSAPDIKNKKLLNYFQSPGWMMMHEVQKSTSSDSTEFQRQNENNDAEAQGSQFVEDEKELNKMLETIFGSNSTCLVELDNELCPQNYFDKLHEFGRDAYIKFLQLKGFAFGVKLMNKQQKNKKISSQNDWKSWLLSSGKVTAGVLGYMAYESLPEDDENKSVGSSFNLERDSTAENNLGFLGSISSFFDNFSYVMEKTMFVETIEPFVMGVSAAYLARTPLFPSLLPSDGMVVTLIDATASLYKWIFILSVLVLPLVPLSVWVLSVSSYLISLFSVLIIVPIWMGFMLSKESLNKSSENLKNLYQLLFKLVLRAPFLVIGVLLSWYLLNFAGDLVLEPIIMLYQSNMVEVKNLNAFALTQYLVELIVGGIYIITVFIFLFVVIFKLLSLIDGIQSFTEDLLFEGNIVRPYGDDSASLVGSHIHSQSKK